jgi:hypothetical protein
MSKLFDRLITAGLIDTNYPVDLESLQKIDGSNISKYMFEVSGNFSLDAASFPNVAPSFRHFWFETKAPTHLFDSKGTTVWKEEISHWGFDVVAAEDNSDSSGVFHHFTSSLPKDKKDNIRWLLLAQLYVEAFGDRFIHCPVLIGIPVSHNGEPILGEGGNIEFMYWPADGVNITMEDLDGAFALTAPLLLAMTFMHIKNGHFEEHTPDEKLQRSRVRKGKLPYFTYSTLVIDPIKKLLSEQGKIATEGIKNALHICRGHFKSFEDKPLFGKHTGLYWWGMQLRGDEKVGVRKHDYKVKTPLLHNAA